MSDEVHRNEELRQRLGQAAAVAALGAIFQGIPEVDEAAVLRPIREELRRLVFEIMACDRAKARDAKMPSAEELKRLMREDNERIMAILCEREYVSIEDLIERVKSEPWTR